MQNYRNKKADAVLGAICGDIIGSVYEFDPIFTKEFELITDRNHLTDDTVMTLAIAKAVMDCKGDYTSLSAAAIYWMQKLGREYPNAGYGTHFAKWIDSDNSLPYNSYGNGAAMRISPVGAIARTIEEAIELSYKVTSVSHNHPEGIKGAEVTAVSIFLAMDKNKEEIRRYTEGQYGQLKDLQYLSENYEYNESCQGTVPESVVCFLESIDYADAIRNCVMLGGDCDTMGAIAGAIAGAYYGVTINKSIILGKLTNQLRSIYEEWEEFTSHK